MSAKCTFTCDFCGTEKNPEDRWFMARENSTQLLGTKRITYLVSFAPWDSDRAAEPGVSHLCGRKCATEHLERTLQKMGEQQ